MGYRDYYGHSFVTVFYGIDGPFRSMIYISKSRVFC